MEISDFSLERLISLVPPPTKPACGGTLSQWKIIESELRKLGHCVTQDVVELSMHYGYGSFKSGDFYLTLSSVFRPAYQGIVEYNDNIFKQMAEHVAPDPWANMFELGCFEYEDGDQGEMGRIFQDTTGDIDDWQIGLCPPLQRFQHSLIDFLIAVLEKRIVPSGFPKSFDDPVFIPNYG